MNQSWKVLFYISESNDNPVKVFLNDLEERERGKILRVVKYIQEYGLDAVLPHVRKLTGIPLWEIRILGKDSIRIVYVVPYEQTVLLLHGFRKKAQKTPQREIRIAMERYIHWIKKRKIQVDK